MINANLEEFLDTGWFSEATLYYNKHTYWCEGDYDETREKPFHIFVYRYRSVIVREIYTKRLTVDDEVLDYSTVLDEYANNEDEAREIFFSAKIFDGKSFWEVEKELAWYDEI